MTNELRSPGASLLIGSVLVFLTMVLHPVGGNLDQLRKISNIIIVSHSLALLAVPFIIYGYWALTSCLSSQFEISKLAFVFACFGLLSILIAGTVNGLVLPIFIECADFSQDPGEAFSDLIFNYNFSINQAFDLLFIAGTCISIILWSIGILKSRFLPRWFPVAGILLSVVFIVLVLSGFNLENVKSLRLFMTPIVLWNVALGILLMRK